MLQLRGEVDLALEAFAIDAGRQVGRQDLDYDLPGEGALRGDEHAAHAAALELAFEGVGAADRGFQLVPQRITHR